MDEGANVKHLWFCSISAGILYAYAAWFWPWAGPALLSPCPMPTPLMIWLFVGLGTLRAWVKWVNEQRDRERRALLFGYAGWKGKGA